MCAHACQVLDRQASFMSYDNAYKAAIESVTNDAHNIHDYNTINNSSNDTNTTSHHDINS